MVKLAVTKTLLPALCLGALAACTPAEETVTAPATPPAEGAATAIVLPDGTECLNAGQGATLTFEGQRLNYTCNDTTGLVGDVVITNGTEMTLAVATLEGTTITESEAMGLTVNAVELADGTVCLNAGQGATLAFEGKRLNFTCPDAAVEAGLLGDITDDDGVFSVEMATLEGTQLVGTETVTLSRLETAMP
jgi:hypothetical protein